MLPNELVMHIYSYMDVRTNIIRVFPWLRQINVKCSYCNNNISNFLIRYINKSDCSINNKEKTLCGSLCKNFKQSDFTLYHFYDKSKFITLMLSPNEEDILFKMELNDSFISDKALKIIVKKFLYEKEDQYLQPIIREFYRKLPKRKRYALNITF